MEIIGKGSTVQLEKMKNGKEVPKSRCRKWRLKVHTELGIKTRRFSGTWSQADKALDDFINELLETPTETKTFREYADKWLKYREKIGNYAKRTIEKDKNCINALCYHLGDLELTDITSEAIREAYLAYKDGESPSGKPLSGTYLRACHTKLNQIMEAALEDELINKNPCIKMEAPKIDTEEKEALTKERVVEFLDELDARGVDSHTVAMKLIILTGLRRSEICALRWKNYDGDSLIVTNGAEEDGSLKGPKTAKSARKIPCPPELRETLNTWFKKQTRALAKLGVDHDDDTRIVTTVYGGDMKPRNLNKWWERNRDSFGFPGVKPHELRHTYITLLVHSGVDIKTAQTLSGHSKTDTLLKIYAHRDQELERKAMDNLLGYIKGDSASKEITEVPVEVPIDKNKKSRKSDCSSDLQ